MQIQVDITEHVYNNIMALDSISLGRIPYKGIIMAAINAIKSGEVVNEERTRKGHWIEEFKDVEGEVRFTCSCCGKYQLFETDYCYNCGSDNREV